MTKPTYRMEFSKDYISKDLTKVWKEQVEPVFAYHGLTCTMDEDECKMILETGNSDGGYIIERARRALGALACGLSAQWVKPILLGQIYCDMIEIEPPEGICEEQFLSNYDDFIDKFDNLYELQKKWYCYVLYFEKCITVVATSFQATCAIRSLVQDSLLGTIPIQDKVEKLTGYIEEYDPKGEVLTNNLEFFSSLLDGIAE
ncbi:PREDICTED: uncharacterized protein LOC101291915 [Fragaria vesca subsp. vesca]